MTSYFWRSIMAATGENVSEIYKGEHKLMVSASYGFPVTWKERSKEQIWCAYKQNIAIVQLYCVYLEKKYRAKWFPHCNKQTTAACVFCNHNKYLLLDSKPFPSSL